MSAAPALDGVPVSQPAGGGICRDCLHFQRDPLHLERVYPGLNTMGSGFGAVRAQDGLCTRHDRYLPATCACPTFLPLMRSR